LKRGAGPKNEAPRNATKAVKTGPKRKRWISGNSQFINLIGISEKHSRVKQRIRPVLGFKRFDSAAITISGMELAAKIKKHQFQVGKLPGRPKTIPAIWTAVVAA
jgi:transposase-like protein